jgi:menaquinone-dependent protoporphyrinogen IX oxidase
VTGFGPDLPVLVAVCSRYGGTAEMASCAADGIREGGDRAAVVVRSAADVDDVSDYRQAR